MTTTATAVPLSPARIGEAGEVHARAFHDNPLSVWALPDESRRDRAQRWSFEITARYALRRGEVYTTAGDVKGSAVWMPPGAYPMSLTRLLLAGWILAPLKLGPSAFRRFMTAMDKMERLHKRDVPTPHWYLMILGVDPPHQGQGIGGALLQPVLAKADRERLPCYLETDKEINVRFYGKHGFEVVVDDHMPDGPRFWTMKREPVG